MWRRPVRARPQPPRGTFFDSAWLEGVPHRPRFMRVCRAMEYVSSDGVRYSVWHGMETDGASIPKILWPVLGHPFYGRHRDAALVHDALCQLGRMGVAPCDSKRAHWVLRDAVKALGGSRLRAQILYLGCRLFGPRFKGPPDWSGFLTTAAEG